MDRVVFSLVNRREIRADEHFERREDGGVLLNMQGKRVFLGAMEAKLDDAVTHANRRLSYRRLIGDEAVRFQRMVYFGARYKPYRQR